ncbi:MAG TPA: hypothetical protein VE982_03730 [Gaiellaceae bacterium]|nr:hypothetical protein [Gaiellaceae bacterium]
MRTTTRWPRPAAASGPTVEATVVEAAPAEPSAAFDAAGAPAGPLAAAGVGAVDGAAAAA